MSTLPRELPIINAFKWCELLVNTTTMTGLKKFFDGILLQGLLRYISHPIILFVSKRGVCSSRWDCLWFVSKALSLHTTWFRYVIFRRLSGTWLWPRVSVEDLLWMLSQRQYDHPWPNTPENAMVLKTPRKECGRQWHYLLGLSLSRFYYLPSRRL